MAESDPDKASVIPQIPDGQLLDSYRQVLTTTFAGSLIVIAVFALALGIIAKNPAILWYVILAGSLGAFFSALTRLYNFQDLPRALLEPRLKLRNAYLVMYALVPPVIGAIAATVLYVAFAARLLDGTLFPHFACKVSDCTEFDKFIWSFGPATPEDYAKALVWGFAAGFSERLVPDLLQRSMEQSAAGKPT